MDSMRFIHCSHLLGIAEKCYQVKMNTNYWELKCLENMKKRLA